MGMGKGLSRYVIWYGQLISASPDRLGLDLTLGRIGFDSRLHVQAELGMCQFARVGYARHVLVVVEFRVLSISFTLHLLALTVHFSVVRCAVVRCLYCSRRCRLGTWKPKCMTKSSSDILYELDPKIDRTLRSSSTINPDFNLVSRNRWRIMIERSRSWPRRMWCINLGEDPHKHLKEFHVVCSTMRPQGILEDYIKMKAFPFSLDGATKDWLYL
ncbi:hypothetical protein CR513_41793, partial [Mucuna pruriens]